MNNRHENFVDSLRENTNSQKSAYEKAKASFYAQKNSLKYVESNRDDCYDGYFDLGDDNYEHDECI